MRHAHQTDANQQAVVEALRAAGVKVIVVSQHSGLGYDLIARRRDTLRLLEVKDGSKPPSERKLTESEKRAARELDVWWRLVLCPEDALREMGLMR